MGSKIFIILLAIAALVAFYKGGWVITHSSSIPAETEGLILILIGAVFLVGSATVYAICDLRKHLIKTFKSNERHK